MDTSTPRRSDRPSRRPYPKFNRWLVLTLGGLVVVGLVCLVVATRVPVRDLGYGAFKRALARGEVRSVRVGTSELVGELKEPGLKGEPTRFRASRVGMENDAELPSLLDKQVPDAAYEADSGPSAIQAIGIPILMLAVACGLIWMLLHRGGGLGTAMSFAKSRHREYDKSGVRVTFEDVAGNDEAVAELNEVAEFLRTPEKYRALGGRIPKGVLLAGPPGTGKTLLARAVAGEAGVPFFSLSGSDFVEMFVGVGAARVRNLFAQAEAKAPCLVFIDELDAIGKARGSGSAGSHDERDQTLNQLLVAMDGFDANSGVIVMAATNRPETLDPALVRPGRFDRHVTVDRPDISGREEILKVHAKKVALEDQINLRHIAAMTAGFVGADLENLVNEAALLAARKGKDRVGRLEFEEGVERVIAGPEKKQRVLRPDERLRIAYHEAGHALVARSLPHTDPVHKVSILGRASGTLGYTMYRPEDDRFLHTQGWLENTIRTLLGGTIAEELVYGEVSDGCTSDLQRASSIARKMVGEFGMSRAIGRVSYQNDGRSPFMAGGGANRETWSEQTAREIDVEVRRVLDDAERATRIILEHRRMALEDITCLLIEKESIDAAELQAALDRHPFDLASLGLGPKPAATLLPPPREVVPPFRASGPLP